MSTGVVVFGREPVPGRVKTRLAARLGAAAAAAVYEALLTHALAEATATGWHVTLSLAEAPSPGWRPPAAVAMEVQPPGSLGERMAAAFRRAFAANRDPVVLVGSDLPLLSRSHLADAAEGAGRRGVALGPALDGGYYLVAQRAPGLDLFDAIPWSSPRTFEATLARARSLGVEPALLPLLPDADTTGDLREALTNPGLDTGLRAVIGAALSRAQGRTLRDGSGGAEEETP